MVVSSEMTARGLEYKVTRVERGEMIGNVHERLFLPGKYVVFLFLKIRMVERRSIITVVNFLGNEESMLVLVPSGYLIMLWIPILES